MLFGKYVNKYYKKYFWFFFFGIITLIFVDYIQLFIPQILGQIVDGVNNQYITFENLTPLIWDVVFIALIGLGMFLGRFVWRICIFGESNRIQFDMRKEMFEKTLRLSQRYYKNNKIGNILSLFSTDLDTIEECFGFGIVQLVDGVFMLIMSLIDMFMLNVGLTLIILVPIVILGVVAFLVDNLMEKAYKARQTAYDHLTDFAQESFTGIRVIKAFVREKRELKEFSRISLDNKEKNIKFQRTSALLDVIFDGLIYIIFGVIILGGTYLVIENIKTGGASGMTVGTMVTYVGYVDTIIWPVFALAGIINIIARGRTSLKRISNFLDEEEEIKDKDDVIKDAKLDGDIVFNHFNFAYPDDPDHLILKDINLTFKKGETIGIVGKVGCGKSTLVNSLFRFYNIKENTIFINGYDIMKLPIKQVREEFGYCPQDNFLFSDTIANNVAFSSKEANQDLIDKATEFSCVRDNIIDFVDGFNTVLGEKGVTLSGGQKQRVSIARAVIKNPDVLVLDDSVSAVDVKTEESILENIKDQRKGKTTFIIASRVSSVKNSNKILVLKDGTVEYFGTHEECLKNSPTYAKMVELQELEKEMEGK